MSNGRPFFRPDHRHAQGRDARSVRDARRDREQHREHQHAEFPALRRLLQGSVGSERGDRRRRRSRPAGHGDDRRSDDRDRWSAGRPAVQGHDDGRQHDADARRRLERRRRSGDGEALAQLCVPTDDWTALASAVHAVAPSHHGTKLMGAYESIEVSASALSAERLAMDTIANNIANANTTRTPEGGAFKRQLVVFAQKPDPTSGGGGATSAGFSYFGQMGTPDSVMNDDSASARAGVEVTQIVPDQTPDRLVYDPGNPDADGQGYVHYPNVEVVKEMVDMMAASRAYEANVTAIQEARTQGNTTLGLLK